MTRDELENLIYERTRCFVDVPVADCILELIAAEREACAKVCESEAAKLGQSRDALSIGICAAAIRARSEV